MAELQRTKPNRPWVLKMGIVLVVALGLGVWFLLDATIWYPQRGWADASYRLWVYLDKAEQAGRLTLRDLPTDDPAAELSRLRERADEGLPLGELETARLDWLRAMRVIGALDTETVRAELTDDPRARLAELRAEWEGPGSRSQPKPLASYDIPVQWAIAVICLGVSAVLILHVARVVRVRYAWDPGEQRLHLPGGATLVPADLEDVDKRLWHKFIVHLKVREGHEELGGKSVKLDLYQHAGLEDWILQMERTAFPERAEEGPAGEGADDAGDEESAGQESERA